MASKYFILFLLISCVSKPTCEKVLDRDAMHFTYINCLNSIDGYKADSVSYECKKYAYSKSFIEKCE